MAKFNKKDHRSSHRGKFIFGKNTNDTESATNFYNLLLKCLYDWAIVFKDDKNNNYVKAFHELVTDKVSFNLNNAEENKNNIN